MRKHKQFNSMLVEELRFNNLMPQLYSEEYRYTFAALVKTLESSLSDNLGKRVEHGIRNDQA